MKRPILLILSFYLLGILTYIKFQANMATYVLLSFTSIIIFNRLREKVKLTVTFLFIGFIMAYSLESKSAVFGDFDSIEGYIFDIKEMEKKSYQDKVSYQYFFQVTSLDGKRVGFKTQFYHDNLLEYGAYYRIRGELAPIVSKDNFKSFNYNNYMKSKKVFSRLKPENLERHEQQSTILRLKGLAYKFLENNLSKNLRGNDLDFAKNLVLGQNFLEKEEKELYSKMGLSHILAISGLHLSIIISALEYLGQHLGIKRSIYSILVCILLALYGFIISFPVSMMRALLMYAIRKLAIFKYMVQDDLNILALTGFVILLINPFLIYTPALFLSFSAIFGLSILQKHMINIFKPNTLVGNILTQNLSIQLAIFPIQIYYFNGFNILSILVNIIIIPIAGIPVVASFAISSGIGSFFSVATWVYTGSIYIISSLVRAISRFDFAYLSFPSFSIHQIFAYFLVILLLLRFRPLIKFYERHKKITISILLFLILGNPILDNFIIQARLNIIDVGQGDAILIRSPKVTSLIDTGGDPFNAERSGQDLLDYLRKNGVNRIDSLFLTHKDIDHSGNLQYLLENIRVDRIFIGPKFELDYRDQRFERLAKGDKLRLSRESKIEVLLDGSQGSNENDYSLVMKLSLNENGVLLTGDMENHEDLIGEHKIDILKVSHHGSKNATSKDLLSRLTPDIALISAGENNRYGHPHIDVIERLENIGSKIYRTDLDGNIEVIFFKKSYFIKTMNKKINLWELFDELFSR